MHTQLTGKKALVTGSSSGIGEAIALRLADEGATVFVHGRNPERTNNVTEIIKSKGGEAHVVLGDLKDQNALEAITEEINQHHGGVDILVNNAGGEAAGAGGKPWLEVTSEEWISTYQANVISAVNMIRHLAPGMRERGWGRLIQIGSIVAHEPQTIIPDYAAAKAAMINLTRGLAKTFANTGVTANSINPGLIATPGVRNWLTTLAEQYGWAKDWESIEQQALKNFVPNKVGRIGRPEDIAHAVAYLASPNADFVTGTDMMVTGGQELVA